MFGQNEKYSYLLSSRSMHKGGLLTMFAVSSELTTLFAQFEKKPFCLLQRVNEGLERDDWERRHESRGDLLTRVISVELPRVNAVGIRGSCSLRLEDPDGNQYEALSFSQIKKNYNTVEQRVHLADSLRIKLENSSYYPYAGALRSSVYSNTLSERIRLVPLDNLEAMNVMDEMKARRTASELRRKQDEEALALKQQLAEASRQKELDERRHYDERNAAVDAAELERMFRSSSK